MARCLHVIPLFCTFCVASGELVGMESPILALIVLLLSVLPLITMVIHHRRWCQGIPLPISTPTMTDSSDTTAMSNYIG
ncbi:hypothetical protein HD554DRAFT_1077225 [Boletus coccyginus]|nr:hypothetical protein HD554DRAFT_1077225 [Boletus coccyginus]